MAQHPLIFDVSTVVVGAQKLETLWFFAEGKWSDASSDVGLNSTDIHCYKRFGFCEVAEAMSLSKTAVLRVEDFDILRWNDDEIIAVDTSPVCITTTLRVDFSAKKVSLSSTSKHETALQTCTDLEPSPQVPHF